MGLLFDIFTSRGFLDILKGREISKNKYGGHQQILRTTGLMVSI